MNACRGCRTLRAARAGWPGRTSPRRGCYEVDSQGTARAGPLRVNSRRHRHCSVLTRMVWGRLGAVAGAALLAVGGVGCGGGTGVAPDAGAADWDFPYG